MFVDEVTEKYLRSSGKLAINKKVGLWRIIVARNLPYTDARRSGKVRIIYDKHNHVCEIKIGMSLLINFLAGFF